MCLDVPQLGELSPVLRNETDVSQLNETDFSHQLSPANPKLTQAIEEMKTKISNAPPKPPLIGKLAATAQSQIRIIKLANKHQQLVQSQL